MTNRAFVKEGFNLYNKKCKGHNMISKRLPLCLFLAGNLLCVAYLHGADSQEKLNDGGIQEDWLTANADGSVEKAEQLDSPREVVVPIGDGNVRGGRGREKEEPFFKTPQEFLWELADESGCRDCCSRLASGCVGLQRRWNVFVQNNIIGQRFDEEEK